MPESYDVIVIGSGTAGQTAAYDLTEKGLTVGVVEHSDRPGGTCALQGCQAKKWFYEGSEVVARSRHMTGIGVDKPADASWMALRDAKKPVYKGCAAAHRRRFRECRHRSHQRAGPFFK
jgi:glutathione reductase (NADPH)